MTAGLAIAKMMSDKAHDHYLRDRAFAGSAQVTDALVDKVLEQIKPAIQMSKRDLIEHMSRISPQQIDQWEQIIADERLADFAENMHFWRDKRRRYLRGFFKESCAKLAEYEISQKRAVESKLRQAEFSRHVARTRAWLNAHDRAKSAGKSADSIRPKGFNFHSRVTSNPLSAANKNQKRRRYSSGPLGRSGGVNPAHSQLTKAAITIQTFYRSRKSMAKVRRAIAQAKQNEDERKRLQAIEAEKRKIQEQENATAEEAKRRAAAHALARMIEKGVTIRNQLDAQLTKYLYDRDLNLLKDSQTMRIIPDDLLLKVWKIFMKRDDDWACKAILKHSTQNQMHLLLKDDPEGRCVITVAARLGCERFIRAMTAHSDVNTQRAEEHAKTSGDRAMTKFLQRMKEQNALTAPKKLTKVGKRVKSKDKNQKRGALAVPNRPTLVVAAPAAAPTLESSAAKSLTKQRSS